MNPFLVLLIIIAVILLWILSVRLFKPIGKVANKVVTEIKDATATEQETSDSTKLVQEEKGENKNE